MSITIDYKYKDTYLFVEISGEWKITHLPNLFENIKAEADKLKTKLIFIDINNLSKPDSDFARFLTGEKLAMVFKYEYKIAACLPTKNINHFGEVVAINRGAHFKIFDNDAEAMIWLLD